MSLPVVLRELPQLRAAAVDLVAADEVEHEAVGIGIAEDVDRQLSLRPEPLTPSRLRTATATSAYPRSTDRIWTFAGRNQWPDDLTLAVNRAWAFRRLPILRLVRGSWLGAGFGWPLGP